ncbi:hypothetical protein JXB27_03790 [Candidatus Woesearchaeota archaeon]|nr:hypothetical protein [Candidatus Woesearchaeota archaeon]
MDETTFHQITRNDFVLYAIHRGMQIDASDVEKDLEFIANSEIPQHVKNALSMRAEKVKEIQVYTHKKPNKFDYTITYFGGDRKIYGKIETDSLKIAEKIKLKKGL